jgi:glucokinase
VGVDLGATNIRAAVVHGDGRSEPALRQSTPPRQSPEEVAEAVARLCREATGGEQPAAVGVGLAGWLDDQKGIVHNGPNLGWRDVPFGRFLELVLQKTKVTLTNDLRAIAWGEYLYGAGRGAHLMTVVFQGSGVGSCTVIEGAPLRGTANIACELGHTRVVPRYGRACGCGRHGCLEAYAGGHNIERRAQQEVQLGISTAILDFAGGEPQDIRCAHIEQAAQANDPYARALWSEVADFLAQALGSLLTYLNPDRLILGGGVWAGAPTLRSLVRDRLPLATNQRAYEGCSIVEPALGDRAGIVGAAALARSKID